eukprot:SAG11_NODE_381_length_9941_cov_11.761885_9_plen_127_part_00
MMEMQALVRESSLLRTSGCCWRWPATGDIRSCERAVAKAVDRYKVFPGELKQACQVGSKRARERKPQSVVSSAKMVFIQIRCFAAQLLHCNKLEDVAPATFTQSAKDHALLQLPFHSSAKPSHHID